MKKLLSISIIMILLFSHLLISSAENTDITTYHLEFRDISLEEAQDVINRTIGSGNTLTESGTILWKGIQSIQDANDNQKLRDWLNKNKNAKIFWWVPFYGPRGLVVANEYYLQCWDKICGSIYEVFPWKKTMEEIMNLFVKGAKCLQIYNCYIPQNHYAIITNSWVIWHFWEMTEEEKNDFHLVWPMIEPMLIPDANPISIRLAKMIPNWRIKFYHGIYAIWENDRQVISLDSRDKGLTKKELKKRLIWLVDFSTKSPTIPLVYERTKIRDFVKTSKDGKIWLLTLEEQRLSEKPFTCLTVDKNTQYEHIGFFYESMCKWLPEWVPLLLWSYNIISPRNIDYLTGRNAEALSWIEWWWSISTYFNLEL